MEYPNFSVCTIDCNCPDIKYKLTINFDENQRQEVVIENYNLFPVLGRTVELLNAHRLELNKQYTKDTNDG